MVRRLLTAVWIAFLMQGQQQPPAQQPPPPVQTASPAGNLVLDLPNASLVDVINILARHLKLNYILDPRVKGTVIVKTYGEIKSVDARSLLETILRINGATMIQVGDIYRIVPIAEAGRLPLKPQVNPDAKEIPEDERMSLNLIFLKYTQVGDMAKLLEPFRGEGSQVSIYEPANLLMVLDNNRNMRRTMELVALFDSDTFATKRVKIFEVKEARPSDLAKELENVFKAYALSEKVSAVRFIAVDRIGVLIGVAPNPGVFEEVEKWIRRLDVPVKSSASATDNYVYRVKYGRAETLAIAIMQLYGGLQYGFGAMGMMGMGGMFGPGLFGAGLYGGMYGAGMGMAGLYGGGMGFPALGGMGAGGYPMMSPPVFTGSGVLPQGASAAAPLTTTTPSSAMAAGGADLTGTYLGAAGATTQNLKIPRVVPNPFDNTLLIQGTPTEYDQIVRLLEKLDVPPRQVLIEARIYEVTLTGALASGVQAFLQKRSAGRENDRGLLSASLENGAVALSTAGLVGKTKELLLFLTAQEEQRRAKVVSAPSVIATDSIPALVNVGQEVPTLSASSTTPIQSGGSSVFANTITNRNAGVTLQILARVIPSGIVTLVINQEVSSPIAPPASAAIQSPSFSKRNVTTQVTVQDGDTIAIAGIIQESDTASTAGIPILNRLPGVGALFGNRSYSKERTELVVFMTPRVIYDTNEMTEASDELRSKLRRLQRMIKE
ncbi:MAG: type II secretion system secretin GspD [Bryobacteraceae bacterium]|nr:type II secretion system secretin GspD [Bryobacteraceae bacterium]MDW8378906.1 type II secretion system secretin GspD [Bryobacterales bacterium]